MLARSALTVLAPAHELGDNTNRCDSYKNVDEVLEPGNAAKDGIDEVVVKEGNETPVETTDD